MGEIEDSMIDGEFDYITGEYLGKGVGYPRTRTSFKPDFKNRSKIKAGRNYQSNKSKVYRIMISEGNKCNLSHIQITSIVEEYAHGELKLQQNVKEKTVYKHILKDDQRFKSWYAEKYPRFSKHLLELKK